MYALYVDNVHLDFNEVGLNQKFSSFRKSSNIKICWNFSARHDSGYVNYSLLTIGYDFEHGRLMMTKYIGSLFAVDMFIKSSQPGIDAKNLHEEFCCYDAILSTKILKRGTEKDQGVGYVQFEAEKPTENAIKSLDDNFKIGLVSKYKSKKSQVYILFYDVYLKNLGLTANEEDFLHHMVENAGRAKLAAERPHEILLGDKYMNTKGTKIILETKREVMAVETPDGKLKQVEKISESKSRSNNAQLKMKFNSIYLKNFGNDVDEKDLIEICQQFGKISSVKVMTDDNGITKGCGLVTFENAESAKMAMECLNGICLGDRYLFAEKAEVKLEEYAVMPIKNLDAKFLPSQGISVSKNPSEKMQKERKIYLRLFTTLHLEFFLNRQSCVKIGK